MKSILTEAQLAQRDASRRLYFVSAGCLYHPRAHLVLDDDPTARVALEQSVEAALQFAELSEEEAAAFRERAVSATRVVRKGDGTYAFRQRDRKPRRRWRRGNVLGWFTSASPESIAPPERRSEARWRAAFLRLVGILAAASFVIWGMRIVMVAVDAFGTGDRLAAAIATSLLGLVLSGIGAVLFCNLIRSRLD